MFTCSRCRKAVGELFVEGVCGACLFQDYQASQTPLARDQIGITPEVYNQLRDGLVDGQGDTDGDIKLPLVQPIKGVGQTTWGDDLILRALQRAIQRTKQANNVLEWELRANLDAALPSHNLLEEMGFFDLD